MRPFKFYYYFALDYYKYYCPDSGRELTFEVDLPADLGELTFKNMSKWVIDHSGVVLTAGARIASRRGQRRAACP